MLLLFLYIGGGKSACRFCGTTANTSLLAIGSVCTDPECQARSDVVCDKMLPCGHPCCGVKGEDKCLPCLYGCAGVDSKLKQDADDMCMMCYTEGLSCAACIQVYTFSILDTYCVDVVTSPNVEQCSVCSLYLWYKCFTFVCCILTSPWWCIQSRDSRHIEMKIHITRVLTVSVCAADGSNNKALQGCLVPN